MYIKYNQFINENKDGITQEEQELLEKYNIKQYEFNQESNLIDIYQAVIVSGYNLTSLPKIRLGTINGYFSCSENNITSLMYSPKKVYGGFYCNKNELKTLEGCPKYVGGDFYCEQNLLFDIEDYPLCIINNNIHHFGSHFIEINGIVKSNKEIFSHLLDDKIKFHQMIMSLDPKLIKYYKTIPLPSKNHKLLI